MDLIVLVTQTLVTHQCLELLIISKTIWQFTCIISYKHFQMSRWFRKRLKQPGRVERASQSPIVYQQYKTRRVLLYCKTDKLSKREHMPNSWFLRVFTTNWSSLKIKSAIKQPRRCANWRRNALLANVFDWLILWHSKSLGNYIFLSTSVKVISSDNATPYIYWKSCKFV